MKMILIILFLRVVVADLNCYSPNNTSRFPFHILVKTSDIAIIYCNSSTDKVYGYFQLESFVQHSDDMKSLTLVLPMQNFSRSDFVKFYCDSGKLTCRFTLVHDYLPKIIRETNMTIFRHSAESVEIEPPFKINKYLPHIWSYRFIINNNASQWSNYTNVTMKRSFTQNTNITHQLRNNKNNSIMFQTFTEVIVRNLEKSMKQYVVTELERHAEADDTQMSVKLIILIVVYVVVLVIIELARLFKK
jgi:hypothetical protein